MAYAVHILNPLVVWGAYRSIKTIFSANSGTESNGKEYSEEENSFPFFSFRPARTYKEYKRGAYHWESIRLLKDKAIIPAMKIVMVNYKLVPKPASYTL